MDKPLANLDFSLRKQAIWEMDEWRAADAGPARLPVSLLSPFPYCVIAGNPRGSPTTCLPTTPPLLTHHVLDVRPSLFFSRLLIGSGAPPDPEVNIRLWDVGPTMVIMWEGSQPGLPGNSLQPCSPLHTPATRPLMVSAASSRLLVGVTAGLHRAISKAPCATPVHLVRSRLPINCGPRLINDKQVATLIMTKIYKYL